MSADKKSRIGAVILPTESSTDTPSAVYPSESPDLVPFTQSPDESMASVSDERLDRLLSDLAQDVPPVPESFRRNWRQTVRQENDSARKITGESGVPADAISRNKDTYVPLSDNVTPIHSGIKPKSHLRRFLSVAATALFLLGGTMLARPSSFVLPRQINSSPAVSSPADFSSLPSSVPYDMTASKTTGDEETAFKAADKEETAFEAAEEEAAFDAFEAEENAFEAVEIEEAAYETAPEEDTNRESDSEEVDFSDTTPPVQAAGQIQSSRPRMNSAGETGNQQSVFLPSVSANARPSATASGSISEAASAAMEAVEAESLTLEKDFNATPMTQTESSEVKSFQPLRILGIVLLARALLLFILRRRI